MTSHGFHPSYLTHVASEEGYVIDAEFLQRPKTEWNEDQLVRVPSACLFLPFTLSCTHLFLFPVFLFFLPAPHSELIKNPARPDPEGESSPLKMNDTQRTESPAKKDTDRRLLTPTKPDVIPRSPGSPASPAPRSKRGKQTQSSIHCLTLNGT